MRLPRSGCARSGAILRSACRLFGSSVLSTTGNTPMRKAPTMPWSIAAISSRVRSISLQQVSGAFGERAPASVSETPRLRALEQGGAEARLQFAHDLGDRGLGQMDALRRPLHRARGGDREQHFQIANAQGCPHAELSDRYSKP